MANLLPDLCELDCEESQCHREELNYEDYYVFHNPLSLLAVVPDVVDVER